MVSKIIRHPILQIAIGVFLIVAVLTVINLYALPRHVFVNFQYWRVYDWFLLESIFIIIIGSMLLIGSGGLSGQTLKSAIDYSLTDETQASEIFRQSRFNPTGFLRMGLVFLFSGLILLAEFLSTL